MTQIRFLLSLLLITLLFLSFSLPSSSLVHESKTHHVSSTSSSTLYKRVFMSPHPLSFKDKKLRVFMKKRSAGGGISSRARGKKSAALSLLHRPLSSVLACSLLLAGFFNL